MLPFVYLLTVLCCGASGHPAPTAASPILAPEQQQQDPKPSPTEHKPSDMPQQQPTAAPATPAVPATPLPPKPPDKPRRVITNDDLKGGGGSGFSPMEFSEINDCDRYCFENVRQLARAPTGSNPNWKRDLLQAIDRVRSDAEWQTYLRELYNVHLKFCQLGDEKREELNRDADPHNVTPREIAIDDKYDAKFQEVQATLQTLYYRQADLQKRFGANPFAFQFSIVQTSRIQNANCAQQRSPRYAPNDADDP
jgi:hypothetical protein